jgi:hypothetical protein
VEEYRTVILLAAATTGLIVVALLIWAFVRRRNRERLARAPLPLIQVGHGRVGPPPSPLRERPTAPFGQHTIDRTAPPSPYAAAEANGRALDPARYAPPPDLAARAPAGTGASSPYAPPAAAASFESAEGDRALARTAIPTDQAAGAAVDGASVRYWRPADGTLQFLPGRLEVISGRDAGHEIRFVRTPGPDGNRITFGRADGLPYRHIQLREPTVSRSHARMTLEAGIGSADARGAAQPGWRLENLSATNPVVVNGRALASDGGNGSGVALRDGDRIEMGEVVFRFHEK